MKKLLKGIFSIAILATIILGVITLGNLLAEWLCADAGRYMLGIGILVYVLYRFFKSEFSE